MENFERKTKAELIAIIQQMEQKKCEPENPSGGDPETIRELREIIEISCKDHCPHHQQEESCRNCAIKKRLDGIGK